MEAFASIVLTETTPKKIKHDKKSSCNSTISETLCSRCFKHLWMLKLLARMRVVLEEQREAVRV